MVPFTSLDAATAVGPGESADLEDVYSRHQLMITASGGSPPTSGGGFTWSAGVALEISYDGVNWVKLTSVGVSTESTPALSPLGSGLARYVRANLTEFATQLGGSPGEISAFIASAP